MQMKNEQEKEQEQKTTPNHHRRVAFLFYWEENNLTLPPMSKTPKYYIGKYKSIEAFDVVLDFQEDNYNLGTAITYLLRAGKKPNNPITQDIKESHCSPSAWVRTPNPQVS